MVRDKLLANAQQGDLNALEKLCEREWRPVYGVVYQAVQNSAEAQDLTQEVFLRALRSLDRYRDTGAPFSAYLGTIARNLVRNRWRTKRPLMVGLEAASGLPSHTADPVDYAVAGEESMEIQAAFHTLSSAHQRVLQLRILEGRTAAEVGRIMGRRPDAIRQLQHRAIVALRTRIREESQL